MLLFFFFTICNLISHIPDKTQPPSLPMTYIFLDVSYITSKGIMVRFRHQMEDIDEVFLPSLFENSALSFQVYFNSIPILPHFSIPLPNSHASSASEEKLDSQSKPLCYIWLKNLCIKLRTLRRKANHVTPRCVLMCVRKKCVKHPTSDETTLPIFTW